MSCKKFILKNIFKKYENYKKSKNFLKSSSSSQNSAKNKKR